MNNSKNIFLQLLVGVILIGAIFLMLKNNKKSNSMSLTYEKNKEILNDFFNAWEEENLEIMSNNLTDDFRGYNYPIMNPKGIFFYKERIY